VFAVARALERGELRGGAAAILAAAWGHVASRGVVRPVSLPAGRRVIAVGGATLGGSGKTPLAIACAVEIAAAGGRVAFVGHAYRAAPRGARVVEEGDALREVGDEALLAARALGGIGVPVIVAPRRAESMALAAQLARVLVVDGVAQTRPARASLALLAVDAEEPWGRAGSVPPLGDLRAPKEALLAACDRVVAVGDGAGDDARVVSRGAWYRGALRPWAELRPARVGLLCALARPERVVRQLARRGVSLVSVVRARDHGPFGRPALAAAARARVDVWLATPKCALHLHEFAALPVAVLDHGVALSAPLRAMCRSLAHAPEGEGYPLERMSLPSDMSGGVASSSGAP